MPIDGQVGFVYIFYMSYNAGWLLLFSFATAMVLCGGWLLGKLIFVKYEPENVLPTAGAFVMAFIIFRSLFRK